MSFLRNRTLQFVRLVAGAILVLGASGRPTRAQLPPLIPRETLFGNAEKDQAQISPDGKMLGYLAPEKGVMNVWVRTIGQADDHVVTADKKRGIRFFFWQQDSEHILYGQDFEGDENYHIYQTSLKSKNTRDLTPYQGVTVGFFATDPNFPDLVLAGLNVRDGRIMHPAVAASLGFDRGSIGKVLPVAA